ncbi:hypothetical protein RBB50_012896 [Rhinocladiella similis]
MIAGANGDTSTPDTSPARQDATAESLNDPHRPFQEASADANVKGENVRSHDTADGAGPVLDEVTKQLTSRLGRPQIAEDGQPRYYGATSNLVEDSVQIPSDVGDDKERD